MGFCLLEDALQMDAHGRERDVQLVGNGLQAVVLKDSDRDLVFPWCQAVYLSKICRRQLNLPIVIDNQDDGDAWPAEAMRIVGSLTLPLPPRSRAVKPQPVPK